MDVLVLIDKLDDLVHNAKAVRSPTRCGSTARRSTRSSIRCARRSRRRSSRRAGSSRNVRRCSRRRNVRATGSWARHASRPCARRRKPRSSQPGGAPGSGDHRRRPPHGQGDETRDGGLGGQHPLDARGQPRQVPRGVKRGRSACTSARRRRWSPAWGRPSPSRTSSRSTSQSARPRCAHTLSGVRRQAAGRGRQGRRVSAIVTRPGRRGSKRRACTQALRWWRKAATFSRMSGRVAT